MTAGEISTDEIIGAIFALGEEVRYVAVANGQRVDLRERPGLADASSPETDRFEELLVNPTLLLLTRQVATDGVLAWRLGYAFLHYTPVMRNVPLGPRLMRQVGVPIKQLLFRNR